MLESDQKDTMMEEKKRRRGGRQVKTSYSWDCTKEAGAPQSRGNGNRTGLPLWEGPGKELPFYYTEVSIYA